MDPVFHVPPLRVLTSFVNICSINIYGGRKGWILKSKVFQTVTWGAPPCAQITRLPVHISLRSAGYRLLSRRSGGYQYSESSIVTGHLAFLRCISFLHSQTIISIEKTKSIFSNLTHEAHLKEIILKVQKQEIIQKQIKVKSGAGKEEGMI